MDDRYWSRTLQRYRIEDRLIHYTIEGVHKASDEAATAAAELLKSGNIAMVGSANSSVEEQFFYKSIAERSSAKVYLVSHLGDGDGLLQSEDRIHQIYVEHLLRV